MAVSKLLLVNNFIQPFQHLVFPQATFFLSNQLLIHGRGETPCGFWDTGQLSLDNIMQSTMGLLTLEEKERSYATCPVWAEKKK